MNTILLAGGGTGGHVFPLIAVAEQLRALRPELRLVFVGTAKGLEAKVVPERGYELELMDVVPILGGGVLGAARGTFGAAAALPAGFGLVRRLRPRAVLSLGGYAAGPITLAARLTGVPVALLEPNAVLGLSNRLVAPLVSRAYTVFPEPEQRLGAARCRRLGVPIRAGFDPQPLSAASPSVLVLGGSQGAKALNEAVPAALAQLGAGVRVVHQCGRGRDEELRARYASLGLSDRATVVPFIDDVPAALAASTLVVSRAGASTLAEICAVGRPSLLVPYPFAAADHQLRNAESLERLGAARLVQNADATPDRLAAELSRLLEDPAATARLAAAATAFGRPQAARAVAEDLLELAGLGLLPTELDERTTEPRERGEETV